MKWFRISEGYFLLLIVVLAGALTLAGCSKDMDSIQSSISDRLYNSSWVESSRKLDTIEFAANADRIFNLKRQKTADNRPAALSGPYFYTLKPDSIAVIWVASSMYNGDLFIPFSIEASGNRLSIGNFYDQSLPSSTILKFDRIR